MPLQWHLVPIAMHGYRNTLLLEGPSTNSAVYCCRQRYFAGWAFAVTSVLLALYLAAIAFKDAEARRPHMTKGGLQDPTSLLQS